jgi:hypothetical protein
VVVPLGVQELPAEFEVLQLGPEICVVGAVGVLVMRVHVMDVPGLSIVWTCIFNMVEQLDGIMLSEH